jgi:DNA-binding transcriptional MerR regulator
LRIGDLAKRTGTSVPTIRYYEQIGLLRRPARSGGQRIYDHEDVRRLAFVRRCRDFDYSIEEVRSLLSLMHGEKSCMEARDVAAGHLAEVRRKLAELKALETAIASLVSACDSSCAGGPASDCVIFQTA